MAEILSGVVVADNIAADVARRVKSLKKREIEPTLAILRVGDNPEDIAYEKSAMKRAESLGIGVMRFTLDRDVKQSRLENAIRIIDADARIHGLLMFRPLPKYIDEKSICEMVPIDKDLDGVTSGSMAGVFMDEESGFPPCTAEACMEILHYYGYNLEGKNVTVMGRSLVIGKPVAMMAMRENATVTVCHSKTSAETFAKAGKEADVVIAAIGKAKIIGADMLGENQIIVDVGINVDENNKVCGDVDFEAVKDKAEAITPVPGGVGNVTTALLMRHVVEAAEKDA